MGFSRKEQDMLDSKAAFSYDLGKDKPRIAGVDWYRGDQCNFIPSRLNLKEENAIDNFILKGWTPPNPFITKDSSVTAFGSCFAQHIRKFLIGKTKPFLIKSKRLPIIHCGEGINTTFAMRQQFEWAWNNQSFIDSIWYDKNGAVLPTEELRQETKQIFDNTDVFILTLGLSEVWANKKTNEVFWRGVPKEIFDPEIHEFRVSTVDQNYDNITKIIQIIKHKNNKAKIIFTLSPVPLVATFRPVSCITANSASKAILKVALDQVMRDGYPDVFYWPAFEIIKEWATDPYEEDNRHIKQEVVNIVLQKFSKYYLV